MNGRKPQAVTIGLICIVLALLVYTQSGCGGGDTRRTTLAAEVAAVKSIRVVFHDWDVQNQERIGSTAESREAGEAKLKAYRVFRDQVTRSFAYVIELLADAAVGEDEYSLVKARTVAGELVKALSTLKPGNDPPADLALPCTTEACK